MERNFKPNEKEYLSAVCGLIILFGIVYFLMSLSRLQKIQE
jgi:hypothetical protein